MESFVMYLLKVNVIFTILFLFILLVFHKRNSFKQTRFCLLVVLVCSFIIPTIPSGINLLPLNKDNITTSNALHNTYKAYNSTSHLYIPAVKILDDSIAKAATKSVSLSFYEYFTYIYLLVTTIFLLNLFASITKVLKIIQSGKIEYSDEVKLCILSNNSPPFSFFNYLVINPSEMSASQYFEIISHEKAHIRQWHSIDVLLTELAHCLLWLNPLLISYKQRLKLNLEFIADSEAINAGVDKRAYQLTVLEYSLNNKKYTLGNLFNSPKIKQRIIMINKTNNAHTNAYKFLFITPAIVVSNLLFGSFIERQTVNTNKENIGTNSTIAIDHLEDFEGFYEFEFKKGKQSFLQIILKDNRIYLKELWSFNVIPFEQLSDYEFRNENNSFSLKFLKDSKGNISELLAFGEDKWKKLPHTQSIKESYKLSPDNIVNIEGYYNSEHNENATVHISVNNNEVVMKSLWNNVEITYTPKSKTEFYLKDTETNAGLNFTTDRNGDVRTIENNGLIWNKKQDYIPLKHVKLSDEKIKTLEGKYTSKIDGKKEFIEITPSNEGVELKGFIEGVHKINLISVSEEKFISKDEPLSIEFSKSENESANNLILYTLLRQNVWTKIK